MRTLGVKSVWRRDESKWPEMTSNQAEMGLLTGE